MATANKKTSIARRRRGPRCGALRTEEIYAILLCRALGMAPRQTALELRAHPDRYGIPPEKWERWRSDAVMFRTAARYYGPLLPSRVQILFDRAIEEAHSIRHSVVLTSKEVRVHELEQLYRDAREDSLGAITPETRLKGMGKAADFLDQIRREVEGDIVTHKIEGSLTVHDVGGLGFAAGIDVRNTKLEDLEDAVLARIEALCRLVPTLSARLAERLHWGAGDRSVPRRRIQSPPDPESID